MYSRECTAGRIRLSTKGQAQPRTRYGPRTVNKGPGTAKTRLGRYANTKNALVRRRLLDAVDNEDFNRPPRGFEFEPELFPYCRENGRA